MSCNFQQMLSRSVSSMPKSFEFYYGDFDSSSELFLIGDSGQQYLKSYSSCLPPLISLNVSGSHDVSILPISSAKLFTIYCSSLIVLIQQLLATASFSIQISLAHSFRHIKCSFTDLSSNSCSWPFFFAFGFITSWIK